uniref:Uncharacterized protein n=1 Tax=Arundo donax TaxID=35708 RepID=A0A0A9A3M5_ARUDO
MNRGNVILNLQRCPLQTANTELNF